MYLFFWVGIVALSRYNLHTIQFAYLNYTIQWYLLYSQNCASITTTILEHFYHPPKETLFPLAVILQSPDLSFQGNH